MADEHTCWCCEEELDDDGYCPNNCYRAEDRDENECYDCGQCFACCTCNPYLEDCDDEEEDFDIDPEVTQTVLEDLGQQRLPEMEES